jgi:F1F0 ATPase subunit 2
MMPAIELSVCAATGAFLACIFYGGLWMTVQRLATARHPAALALGSLALRTACVLAGFLLLNHGRWQNAAAMLLGFIAGRIAVSRFLIACT